MNKTDLKMVAIILIIMGIGFLVVGIFALRYWDWYSSSGSFYNYPYADYGIPLMLVGMIMLTMGIGFFWRAKQG